MAHGLEDLAGAVEIDPVALLEIRLGFAGDDGRQMEDDIGARGDGASGTAGGRDIGRLDRHLALEARRPRRFDHIHQRQARDRLLAQPPILAEAFGQLAADHAGGTENHDMHNALLRDRGDDAVASRAAGCPSIDRPNPASAASRAR